MRKFQSSFYEGSELDINSTKKEESIVEVVQLGQSTAAVGQNSHNKHICNRLIRNWHTAVIITQFDITTKSNCGCSVGWLRRVFTRLRLART